MIFCLYLLNWTFCQLLKILIDIYVHIYRYATEETRAACAAAAPNLGQLVWQKVMRPPPVLTRSHRRQLRRRRACVACFRTANHSTGPLGDAAVLLHTTSPRFRRTIVLAPPRVVNQARIVVFALTITLD